MITEHQLVKVAYIGTFAGIISLFVLVQQMAPDAYTINEIREDMQGRYVNIKCKIHDLCIGIVIIFIWLIISIYFWTSTPIINDKLTLYLCDYPIKIKHNIDNLYIF